MGSGWFHKRPVCKALFCNKRPSEVLCPYHAAMLPDDVMEKVREHRFQEESDEYLLAVRRAVQLIMVLEGHTTAEEAEADKVMMAKALDRTPGPRYKGPRRKGQIGRPRKNGEKFVEPKSAEGEARGPAGGG